MRIDKLLWFLRFYKTRALAQAIAEEGHIRINGKRVERSHQRVAVGDVIVIPQAQGARAIEVLTLPARRGPAIEARACYRELDARGTFAIAAPHQDAPAGGNSQP